MRIWPLRRRAPRLALVAPPDAGLQALAERVDAMAAGIEALAQRQQATEATVDTALRIFTDAFARARVPAPPDLEDTMEMAAPLYVVRAERDSA